MSIKTLSRDFVFYGLLDFLQRSLAILLVPIYTRVLTQTSYGNLDLIVTVCGLLAVLIDLQFIAGFARLYLETRSAGDGPRFVGTALLTRIGLGALVVGIFISLGSLGFLEVKFLPSFLANRLVWTLAAMTILVTFAFDILILQTQMLRYKKLFFAGAVANTGLSMVLSIVLTVFAGMGLVGVVAGQLAGLSVGTLILLVGLRQEITFDFHRNLLGAMAGYSLPLVPGRWLGQATAYANRFFIYAAFGAAENAILAITTKLMAAVGLFCVAFRTAWQPLAMSYIGKESGNVFYVRSTRLLAAGGILSVAIVTLFARPLLAVLVPAPYRVAEFYVPSFLIATVVGEIEVNLQLGNQIAKKTYWITVASAAAFGVNLVILATLTSRIGIHAAGLGLLLSLSARAFITYVTAQRNYRIPYDRRSLAVFGAGCLALVSLSLARSAGWATDSAFYGATAVVGLMVPWFVLDAVDRRPLADLVAALLERMGVRAPRERPERMDDGSIRPRGPLR